MTEQQPTPLRVSDHAMVRYMERVRGICLDEYRVDLQALAAAHQDEPMPPGGEFDDGLIIIVETLGKPVITTVLGRGQRPKRRGQFGTRLIHVPSSAMGANGRAAPPAARHTVDGTADG